MGNVFQYASLGLRALQHMGEIEYLIGKITPYIDQIKHDYPDVVPRVQTLITELFPEMASPAPNFNTEWVQQSLNALGEHLTVDGDYGPATQAAVKRFQQAHGLVVDGWVGLKTCAQLFEEVSKSR